MGLVGRVGLVDGEEQGVTILSASCGTPLQRQRDGAMCCEANFTGLSSHEVSLPTILELLRVEPEIKRLRAPRGFPWPRALPTHPTSL